MKVDIHEVLALVGELTVEKRVLQQRVKQLETEIAALNAPKPPAKPA